MKNRNWKYRDAFKLEVVGLSEEKAREIAEVARLLDIKPKKLAKWIARYGHEGDEKYPGNVIVRLEKEVRDLGEENARLRRENEQLKAAVSFTTAALNK